MNPPLDESWWPVEFGGPDPWCLTATVSLHGRKIYVVHNTESDDIQQKYGRYHVMEPNSPHSLAHLGSLLELRAFLIHLAYPESNGA